MLHRNTTVSAVRIVLEEYGLRGAFALASQSVLIDEMDRFGMRVVQARHETATVGAADSNSCRRRSVGVAIINADLRMANADTGNKWVFETCSPVVVLAGREPLRLNAPKLPVDHDALAMRRCRSTRAPM